MAADQTITMEQTLRAARVHEGQPPPPQEQQRQPKQGKEEQQPPERNAAGGQEQQQISFRDLRVGMPRNGVVTNIVPTLGTFVDVGAKRFLGGVINGLLHKVLKWPDGTPLARGDAISVVVVGIRFADNDFSLMFVPAEALSSGGGGAWRGGDA